MPPGIGRAVVAQVAHLAPEGWEGFLEEELSLELSQESGTWSAKVCN